MRHALQTLAARAGPHYPEAHRGASGLQPSSPPREDYLGSGDSVPMCDLRWTGTALGL